MRRLVKHRLAIVFFGALIGAGLVIGVRMLSLRDNHTHYHANFGLYINGTRDEFNNFTFYEEVTSCAGNDKNNPKLRTHMHNNVNYVVHVHDEAVTWGAFFANLGYTLGNDMIKTDDGLFVEGQDDKKLTFWLNGEPASSVYNKTIADDDLLLVSYGSDDESVLQKQNAAIVDDAKKYDETADPAACSGDPKLTLLERFKQSVWLQSADH